MRLPPSFVLQADGPTTTARADWASCRFVTYLVSIKMRLTLLRDRYFVKVTMGRKGFLKTNERLIVPITYQPRPIDPEGSLLRQVALANGLRPPGPRDDPGGWAAKYDAFLFSLKVTRRADQAIAQPEKQNNKSREEFSRPKRRGLKPFCLCRVQRALRGTPRFRLSSRSVVLSDI